ncbi:MAG: ethylbenzene dehydrogenase-related protein [Gammaproteobacteria bacterium]|nr:ethylbenzene dehydrogenase-related protein [Gammaproteobacteria bacterium]
MKKPLLAILIVSASYLSGISGMDTALAEVTRHEINSQNVVVNVSDEAWQPEGFVNGLTIPAVYLAASEEIKIDGRADEAGWKAAEEIKVRLNYGSTKTAFVKAAYTDKEVFIRVRWADDDENRQYHPWLWSSEEKTYLEGTQVDDALLLSFEAGCDWSPSFFAGHVFDFDGWHWLAARSDPVGQALDLYGNVQDRPVKNGAFSAHPARNTPETWNLKFIENNEPDLHANWDNLDRVYLLQPTNEQIYYQSLVDGREKQPFLQHQPAPTVTPFPWTESKPFTQHSPVKLHAGAGEVNARGLWENGYWTVEFRRDRETPARTLNDVVFNRLTQFSLYIFDQTENIEEASESQRLFLKFLPPGE